MWCPGPELNRYVLLRTRDFKSRASASFATRAGDQISDFTVHVVIGTCCVDNYAVVKSGYVVVLHESRLVPRGLAVVTALGREATEGPSPWGLARLGSAFR